MTDRRTELAKLSDAFVAAFNDYDIDAVMDLMTEDAVFEGLRGEYAAGQADIRTAFTPLLDGTVGKVHFQEVDTFIDETASKVLASWTLTISKGGVSRSLSGLDLLYFRGTKISHKLSYAKAETPLYKSE